MKSNYYYMLQHEGKNVVRQIVTLTGYLQDRQNWTLLGYIQKIKKELKEKEIIDELASIKAILGDSKLCPHCNMAIFKTAGCNIMQCENCGKSFCYRCNKRMQDHRFTRCLLFSSFTLWNVQI